MRVTLVIIATLFGSAALAQDAVFPLDAPPEPALRLCADDCRDDSDGPGVTLTLRNGDAVDVTTFTPRRGGEQSSAVLGAGVSAFGFNVEGAFSGPPGNRTDRMRIGAGFDVGRLSVGGALSFDVDDEAESEGARAGVGLGYDVRPGLRINGSMWMSENGEDGEGEGFGAGLGLDIGF